MTFDAVSSLSGTPSGSLSARLGQRNREGLTNGMGVGKVNQKEAGRVEVGEGGEEGNCAGFMACSNLITIEGLLPDCLVSDLDND